MYRILLPLLITALIAAGPVHAQKADRLLPKPALLRLIDGNLRQAVNQYKILMGRIPPDRLPRSYTAATGKLETSDAGWWTSGFYPGTLLYLYGFSRDTSLLSEARNRLRLLEKEQFNKGTHDLGFMMYCSYGNVLRLIREGALRGPAAALLASRGSPLLATLRRPMTVSCSTVPGHCLPDSMPKWAASAAGIASPGNIP